MRKSGFSWSTVALYITAGATIGLALGVYRGLSTSPAHSSDSHVIVVDINDSITTATNMSAQLPKGRPGTLTPEEEVKLRELWQLTLQVCGIITAPAHAAPNGGVSESQSPALSRTTSGESGATPEKKKKSRLSFLKKKKHEESSHVPSTSAPVAQSTPASGGCRAEPSFEGHMLTY